jgi:hypothetical protein
MHSRIFEEPVAANESSFLTRWEPHSVPTHKDQPESERLFRVVRAVPKQCFFNARKAVLRLHDYEGASYVEGWVMTEIGVLMEHGWVVRDRAIIDPTLPLEAMRYFAGLEFQGRAGIEEFLSTPEGKECKKSPFFYAFGWGGMQSPSFRKCWESARAALQDLMPT